MKTENSISGNKPKTLEEKLKNLVCLVPKPDAINKSSTLLSSHEYTLCDCEVIELLTRFATERAFFNETIKSLKLELFLARPYQDL